MTDFLTITDELVELHDKKALDYGSDEDPLHNVRASEAWDVPAWVGAMIRLNDKVKRLQKLAKRGELANESAIDSFNDIAVYAIIARILYEETMEKKVAEILPKTRVRPTARHPEEPFLRNLS